MKVLRAHDVLPLMEQREPGFRGLRRIMAWFIVAVVVAVILCAATAIRDAGIQAKTIRPPVQPCICMGKCLKR
jgi:hypothetical protein